MMGPSRAATLAPISPIFAFEPYEARTFALKLNTFQLAALGSSDFRGAGATFRNRTTAAADFLVAARIVRT
jgi:hypothetical protein